MENVTKTKNYGIKLGSVSPTDYFAGALSNTPINPTGDWTNFLPVYEPQTLADGTDERGCWQWGTLNALEILSNFLENKTTNNFSERFIYNGMNSEPTGGDPFQAGLWVRSNGCIDEALLPIPQSYQEFITPRPLTEKLIQCGKLFLDKYEIKQEYLWNDGEGVVSDKRERITEYLKCSPLGISVYAWVRDDNGLYYRPQNAPDVHYCVLFKENDNSYEVLDTYDQNVKLVRKDMVDNSTICIRYQIISKLGVESNEGQSLLHKLFYKIKSFIINLWKRKLV